MPSKAGRVKFPKWWPHPTYPYLLKKLTPKQLRIFNNEKRKYLREVTRIRPGSETPEKERRKLIEYAESEGLVGALGHREEKAMGLVRGAVRGAAKLEIQVKIAEAAKNLPNGMAAKRREAEARQLMRGRFEPRGKKMKKGH